MSLIMTKAKSSKIHIGEIIVKSSDCKKKLTKIASISSINPAN